MYAERKINSLSFMNLPNSGRKNQELTGQNAKRVDRTPDLQNFSLLLSQLSYLGDTKQAM